MPSAPREMFRLAVHEDGTVSVYPSPEMSAEDMPAMVAAHASVVQTLEEALQGT